MSTSMSRGAKIGDRWRVTGLVGQGGFGQVYRCVDESHIGLGEAAVKVLHPNTTPQERNDFIREVKKIAQLRHQNLVGYLDSGFVKIDGEVHPYLVTELCRGSLDDRLRAEVDRRLGAEQAIGILLDVSAGLAHLDDRGMIHRDIKPGNVLQGQGGWKLADFGLVRDLTATGSYHRGDAVRGTPFFMAPELFTTMAATAPSDVYALGVLAHLCLAGRPVHTGTGPALIQSIATVPPSIDPGLDRRFQQLIGQALHPDPEQRPTADQFHRHLTEIGRHPVTLTPDPPRHLDPVAAGPIHITTSSNNVGVDPPPPPPPTPSPSTNPWPIVAALVAAGLVVALGGLGVAAFGLFTAEDSGASASTDRVQTLADGGDDAGAGGNDGGIISSSTDDGVTIGDGVDIGDGVIVGGETGQVGDDGPDGGDAILPVAVPQPEDHFDQEPCADGPGRWLMLTNRHHQAVDYVVQIDHVDAAGVTIDDNRETVRALASGETTRIDIETSEEGAAGCRLVGIEAAETSAADLTNRDQVALDACQTDIGGHEITVTVTNPLDRPADAEVYVAVSTNDGVRVDEDWAGIDIFDMSPGEAVRETDRVVFWALGPLGDPPVDCRIVAVEFDPR